MERRPLQRSRQTRSVSYDDDSGVGRGEQHLKKSIGLLRTTSTLRHGDYYSFMAQQERYARAKWADILNVSKSGYYSWSKEWERRRIGHSARTEEVLRIFEEGAGHYGVERICGILRSRGSTASYRSVKRILAENNLRSSHARRRPRPLTHSRKALGDGFANLTRGLEVEVPFQVLSSDISSIRTGEGLEYLCQIQDVYSNAILGRCQQERMTSDIVLKALASAHERWGLPRGVIFRSDRGSQYTSDKVMQEMHALGLRQSFSRVGCPGDNA